MRYLILLVLGCLTALIVGVASANIPAPVTTDEPVNEKTVDQKRNNCQKLYTRKQFRKAARSVYHSTSRVTRGEKRQIKKFLKCQHSDRSARLARRFLNKLKAHYASYPQVWRRKWHRLPQAGRDWARATSLCESNNRRVAPEGGFLSYFQWTLDTWYRAGGDRHPYAATYYHQAVLAWYWHLKVPRGQWPNCGE